ncbi:unnamed protein product [Cochlearia groenlandica]
MGDSKEKQFDVFKVEEVIDGGLVKSTKIPSSKKRTKVKPVKRSVKKDSRMLLIPQRCDGDSIEYKVKTKGTSRSFSKARVILSEELKEKGEDAIKVMMNKVFALKMSGDGDHFEASSSTSPG